MKRKIVVTAIYFLISIACSFAETVEFYATVSSSADANMIKMTTDLLYTQIQTMDGYSVTDRRNETYNPANKSPNISFYVEVQEDEGGGWLCSLNAFKRELSFTSTKKYDTYYKILMDAKASLENFMLNLSGNFSMPEPNTQNTQETEHKPPVPQKNPVMDAIAGTWTGDELIEKILILRGGRGFIVFKNGASMNITVSAENNSVTIRQNGKPNASFYPELPRQEALKNAAGANPIEWNLTLEGNTLKGIKKTLVEDSKSSTGVSEGTVKVSWTKQH